MKSDEIKVSVVVPVYNVAPYLRRTIESVLSQTLQEIELICVDDASQDNGREIIEAYAAADPRVKPIFHAVNQSTSQARKDGVAAAVGKYIMFLDGDDELSPEACRSAYDAIEKNGTDMVQFDTQIINCANLPQARIQANQKRLKPNLSRIENPDGLLSACWTEKKIGFTLWNKIYKSDICRKAFSLVEDGSFPKAQDFYAFYFIARYSVSYCGLDQKLYRYYFGRGITGSNVMPLEKYKILLTEKKVSDALKRFEDAQENPEEYHEITKSIERHFLTECVNRWRDNLAVKDTADGFRALADVWGPEAVLCTLAESNWFQQAPLAEKLKNSDVFAYRKRGKKKTVAFYYKTIINGGAQRVTVELCNLLAELRDADGEPLYRIVLITDEEESAERDEEYDLQETIVRAYLPKHDAAVRQNYGVRYRAWQRILDQYTIDVVVSGVWENTCVFWDMLAVKGHHSHPAYMIHVHSLCLLPYQYENDRALTLTYMYEMCDGVIVLSETDGRFVRAFCRNTAVIPNPIGYLKDNRPGEEKVRHSLLWAGRITQVKRPLDLIYTMQELVNQVPDAVLYIVGRGEKKLEDRMRETVQALGLQEHIFFEGFTKDVDAWYQRAEVFLCTSEREGFSLTIAEALSHGIPAVMYDLPWLTLQKDGRGICAVEQGRYDLMADEAAKLLLNPQMAQDLGAKGREQIDDLLKVDVGSLWSALLDKADQNVDGQRLDLNLDIDMPARYAEAEADADDRILFRCLSLYQNQAKDRMHSANLKTRNEYEKKRNAAARDYAEKEKCAASRYARLEEKYDKTADKVRVLRKKNKALRAKNDQLLLEVKKQEDENRRMRESAIWKVGRAVTWPFRKIRRLVKRQG